MKNIFFIFCCVVSLLNAQVTLHVTSIPTNTPADDEIFVAGSFNGWNPGDSAFQLIENNGSWSVTIPEGTGQAEYKYTRGSWATVEGSENGGYIDNRIFTFTGEPQTIQDQIILSWEDLGETSQSTAAWNVSVLAEDFYMPQLDRERKIWLYLPPDYETSAKNYPVIYMHDGQNLFDNQTAFAGEWEVDETLNSLFEQGDYGVIVVGIENGQQMRIDEYSPWVNTAYGGGEGEAYMQFITETLKPFIDDTYRTLEQPEYTALIGSSMGGLISTYGGVHDWDTFEKIGVLSPSYWFALNEMNTYIENSTADLSDMRIYFVASANESPTMANNINTVKLNLENKGLTSDNSMVKIDTYGGHNEGYWSGEFAAAYQWLFAGENLSIQEVHVQHEIKYHLSQNSITVHGLKGTDHTVFYNMHGQKVCEVSLSDGINVIPCLLKRGVYIVKGTKINAKLLLK